VAVVAVVAVVADVADGLVVVAAVVVVVAVVVAAGAGGGDFGAVAVATGGAAVVFVSVRPVEHAERATRASAPVVSARMERRGDGVVILEQAPLISEFRRDPEEMFRRVVFES
jgi:hypothetical protein